MLFELLQKGYGKAMNLNCAEKILYGANWAYNMQLPPQVLKIAAGFGGGMGAGAACGVVTGACMVLSTLYVKRNGKEEGCRVRELCKEFVDTFKAETGSYDCCEVKPKYFEPEIQCDKVVFKGAEILDKIVAREGLGK